MKSILIQATTKKQCNESKKKKTKTKQIQNTVIKRSKSDKPADPMPRDQCSIWEKVSTFHIYIIRSNIIYMF